MMCREMEIMRDEAEARGLAQGTANGVIQVGRLMGLTDEQIVANLISVCRVTREGAMQLLVGQGASAI